MTVFYRMCGIPSTNPSPIFQEDKFNLNKLCLRSFVQAFKDVSPTVVFILDYCGPEYIEMINSICPFDKEINITEVGINETMMLSYSMARQVEDNIILFQECDYFYRPNIGVEFESAIDRFGLVSPYDHLNFYLDSNIHRSNPQLQLWNGKHFRDSERNTMTFGVTKEVFRENFDIFAKYGYLDNEVWRELKINFGPLWQPIPSYATHMVKDYMSPGVNWKDEFEQYL